jgi:hypothetical protein
LRCVRGGGAAGGKPLSEAIKIRHPLQKAERLGAIIKELLAPEYERLEIAGSIRRRKPMVGDIEIIYVPQKRRIMEAVGWFHQREKWVGAADDLIEEMVGDGRLSKRLKKDGTATWGEKSKLAVAGKGDTRHKATIFLHGHRKGKALQTAKLAAKARRIRKIDSRNSSMIAMKNPPL